MLRLFSKIKFGLSFFMIVVLFLCLSQTVMAAEATGSIKLSYQVEGAEFNLYRVGSKTEEGDIILTDEFSDYNVDLESENAASTLASYIESDNKQPLATAVTNKDFSVSFAELSEGVYLIIGLVTTVDNVTYTAMPVMVSLPYWNDDILVWDLEVNGKYEKDILDDSTDISVLKIWKDEGNEKLRPKDVTVCLTKNGEIYDTVKLNSENSWKCSWNNLDKNCKWSVIEQNVTTGYEVNISQDNRNFVITNTYKLPNQPTNSNTSNISPLPQTGQLWWPVYVFAFVGLAFVVVGVMYRRKNV